MPRYEVIITRDITESTTIVVSADNQEQAEDVALANLSRQDITIWEVDDGSEGSNDPYVTNIEESE